MQSEMAMTTSDRLKSVAISSMRLFVSHTLHCLPTSLWRRLCPKSELGFCYHVISDAKVPHIRHYPILTRAQFEADLIYLQRNFDFVSYEQLVRRRGASSIIRDNSVVLTFDDGFAECATVAAPILRQHGADCVFFVITDLIDNRLSFRESEASLCIEAILGSSIESVEEVVRHLGIDARLRAPPEKASSALRRLPLDIASLDRPPDPRFRPLFHWLLTIGEADRGLMRELAAGLGIDSHAYLRTAEPYLTTRQIRQLRSDGFTIGAHSLSHRWLQDLSRADAQHEIVDSCRIIRDITGQKSVPFAFPYSGGGIDRAWLAQLRRQHDFIGLFFDSDGLREDEAFVVQRVFGERFGHDQTLDAILRREWGRRASWRKHHQYAT
jgi:peptidoglycan/xylan/chitin deacetylase (PgdA/CDA1 family)